jgi:hypothetical protein
MSNGARSRASGTSSPWRRRSCSRARSSACSPPSARAVASARWVVRRKACCAIWRKSTSRPASRRRIGTGTAPRRASSSVRRTSTAVFPDPHTADHHVRAPVLVVAKVVLQDIADIVASDDPADDLTYGLDELGRSFTRFPHERTLHALQPPEDEHERTDGQRADREENRCGDAACESGLLATLLHALHRDPEEGIVEDDVPGHCEDGGRRESEQRDGCQPDGPSPDDRHGSPAPAMAALSIPVGANELASGAPERSGHLLAACPPSKRAAETPGPAPKQQPCADLPRASHELQGAVPRGNAASTTSAFASVDHQLRSLSMIRSTSRLVTSVTSGRGYGLTPAYVRSTCRRSCATRERRNDLHPT